MGMAQRMRWFATQAALNMALIWALRESSRLLFLVKEGMYSQKKILPQELGRNRVHRVDENVI